MTISDRQTSGVTSGDGDFDAPVAAAFRKIRVGLLVFLLLVLVAILGYISAGWSLADSVYMVIITIFGVGYGEVQPVDTWPLRGLTIAVIVVGYGAVIYTVGGFIQWVVDGELNRALGARKMTKEIDQLNGHTIICGFGRMGRQLAKSLVDSGRSFVVVDHDEEILAQTEALGYLALIGDASDESVLSQAGIARATVLATVLPKDASNVFVTLTARGMSSQLTILARGENPRTEQKLLSCGADQVVFPASIGAFKMSQLILRPTADELLAQLSAGESDGIDVLRFGLEFDQVKIDDTCGLVGRTLAEMVVRGAHGYLVIGLRSSDGSTVLHPDAETVLNLGDTVVLLGYEDDMLEVDAVHQPLQRPAS